MNTKGTKFLAVMAVLAMAFTAFAVVDNGATEDAADITYIHGDIIKDQSYTAGKIIVDQDLNVKNGAILSISGTAEFIVPANVTLTIDGKGATDGTSSHQNDPAKLMVNKSDSANNASVTVDGTIIVGEDGEFIFKAAGKNTDGEYIFSIVNGSVSVNRGGVVSFEALMGGSTDHVQNAIIFADGSSLSVASTGKASKISGAIAMETGSNASITAIIADPGLMVTAYDVQMDDPKVDSIKAGMVIAPGIQSVSSTSDLSKITISVGSNVYNAWKDVDDTNAVDMQKFKIIEQILNITLNIKNGEYISLGADSESDVYYDKKEKGELITPSASVVFKGENIFKGAAALSGAPSLFLNRGNIYLEQDATLTFKYDGASAKNSKFATEAGTNMYVAGTVKMTTDNIFNYTNEGCLYIDGGIVEITKKDDNPKAIEETDVALATGGIRGAWFFNEDRDVLTICEIEDAFAAAALDDEIEKIIVTGIDYTDKDDVDTAYYIKSDLTVWDGFVLEFGDNVVIDYGVTLTILEGGAVGLTKFYTNSAAYVDIKGAIYDENCSIQKIDGGEIAIDKIFFNYNVIVTDKDNTYEIYMSFANAMDVAQAGDEFEIVKPVILDTIVTIPEGVTVTMKDLDPKCNGILIINNGDDYNGKLINNGILDTTDGFVYLIPDEDYPIVESADYDRYFVNNNIVILDGENFGACGAEVYPTGFYGEGKIFDEKTKTRYFLSPAAAEENSILLTYLEVKGDVVADELTFVSGEDDLELRVQKGSSLTVGELNLDNGVEFIVSKDSAPDYGLFTGAVSYNTTAGKSTLVLDEQGSFTLKVEEEDEDDDVVITTMVFTNYVTDTSDVDSLYIGSFAVVSGLVEIKNSATSTTVNTNMGESVIYVADGATLVIDDKVDMVSASKDGEYDFVIDGMLVFANGTSSIDEAFILLNGEMEVYGAVTMSDGLMSVLGSVMISEDEDDAAKLTLDDFNMYLGFDLIDFTGAIPYSANAVNAISGEIGFTDNALLYNYGYDLTGADLGTAVYTDFMVDGKLFATVYAAKNNSAAMIGKNAPFMPVDVKGYYLDFEIFETGIGTNKKVAYNGWYTDVDMTKPIVYFDSTIVENGKYTAKKVGEVEVVYGALASKTVDIATSTGVGITLYFDGIKVDTPYLIEDVKIGTYTIETIVQPGYQSDVKIMFDGKEIKDGKLVITADIVEDFYDGGDVPKLTAMGEVTPIPEPTPGMSITEILLIVLVILIAIMAVIVALRLNRS